MIQIVSVETINALPTAANQPAADKPFTNGKGNLAGVYEPYNHRLDVPRWLTARCVTFTTKDRPTSDGRTV